MLQYLIILLDETSTSYCYYNNTHQEQRLINKDILNAAITFAMKENLCIQFVYPAYELPQTYNELIETVDHSEIKPSCCSDETTNVVVFNDWNSFQTYSFLPHQVYVLRTNKDDFFNNNNLITKTLKHIERLNIVITDIDTFDEEDIQDYQAVLQSFSEEIEKIYLQGKQIQLNLLTDRMMLDKMNNCNAGWHNITLAPNGKFYICPAFYLEDETKHIGDLKNGWEQKNAYLYQLEYAPICRHCDAFQCKRCVWLNQKTTLEINTPSHEQCIIAHIERNTSRLLLQNIRQYGKFLEGHTIPEINYTDPFEISKRF